MDVKAGSMKRIAMVIALVGLTACQQTIPFSGNRPGDSPTETIGLPPQSAVQEEALSTTSPPQLHDENGTFISEILSDENDFEAVSSRHTIESDAERIAKNRSRYVRIAPTELPVRPGTNIPNIVAYALQTNNPLKKQLYQRGLFASEKRALVNCNAYPSPGKAQEVFLSKGGPKWDRYGLDPDGDGFACTWDPTPFRLARSKG